MNELYWKCPVCKYVAENSEEKRAHLIRMYRDWEHRIIPVEDKQEIIKLLSSAP